MGEDLYGLGARGLCTKRSAYELGCVVVIDNLEPKHGRRRHDLVRRFYSHREAMHGVS
jgi:hypothetical protein